MWYWCRQSFYKKGFSLSRNYQQSVVEGLMLPATCLILLIIDSSIFKSSDKGPGASHAPVWMAITTGLIIGVIIQRTRFCFIGMAKNAFLSRNYTMAIGVLTLLLVVIVGNILIGKINIGFDNQPVAHNDGVWNFFSMSLVGLCGVFITGCPLRQLTNAGQGNTDSAISVLGMLTGAALAHNFSFASSPAGVTENGKQIVIIGLVLTIDIGIIYTWRANKESGVENDV
ncbi:TPA: YedE family putative selenium transporter [Escherichia coli]